AGAPRAPVVPGGAPAPPPPPPQGGDARPRPGCALQRPNHALSPHETPLGGPGEAGGAPLPRLERPPPPPRTPGGLPPPALPPSVLRSTLGGMLSVRTPGKSTPRHGILEDAVLGVSAVLADGRAVHTRVAPRRATGPDLGRAFLGSEGALGIVTGVVLRIHR